MLFRELLGQEFVILTVEEAMHMYRLNNCKRLSLC